MSAVDECGIALSPWVLYKELDFKSVPTEAGTYVIARDEPINRMQGVDTDGVLTIGESGALRQRLRTFIRCAERRGCLGHSAGWRFAHLELSQLCPLERLRVRWTPAKDKRAAKIMEGKLLSTYLRFHKEQPPLNYSSNWTVE